MITKDPLLANKPVRILYVNSSSEIGGADIDLLEICSHIDRDRFELIIVLPHVGPLSKEFERAKVRIIYLDPAPIKRFRTPIQMALYPFRFTIAIIQLIQLILREKPTIVHVNTSVLPTAGIAAKVARVRCVWHVREIELLQRSRIVGGMLRMCIRRCADRIVAISHAVATAMGEAAQPNISVIYHGVDTTRFQPQAINQSLRRELGIPTSAHVIGFIGRLAPIKGLEYLIQALHQILPTDPDAYLLLVGPDPGYQEYVASLYRQTANLGLTERVLFLPGRNDIPNVIHTMDLVVLPTIIPEGLGLVILEALASGKPVIATNQGGPIEILSGCAAGRLVPPKDATALAQAALELLNLPSEHRQLLGKEARAWAIKHFSVNRMIDELSSVYVAVSSIH